MQIKSENLLLGVEKEETESAAMEERWPSLHGGRFNCRKFREAPTGIHSEGDRGDPEKGNSSCEKLPQNMQRTQSKSEYHSLKVSKSKYPDP